MADTVTTQTISDTSGVKFVAKLTNFSDGTGETLVKKVDASELTFMSEDGNRTIARVYYSINMGLIYFILIQNKFGNILLILILGNDGNIQ